MAASQKLIKFLDKNKVKYELLKHKTVYTAFDKAATLRVSEKIVGKTLVVKSGKEMALVLIPANKNLDLQGFKKITKSKKVSFIAENWMKKNLKGIKIGAVPPLGILWKLSTFIDRGLMKNSKIIVNSGDYNYSVKISPAGLKKIIPDLIVGNFSKKR